MAAGRQTCLLCDIADMSAVGWRSTGHRRTGWRTAVAVAKRRFHRGLLCSHDKQNKKIHVYFTWLSRPAKKNVCCVFYNNFQCFHWHIAKWLARNILCDSLEARNHPTNVKKRTPIHKIPNAVIQIPYPFPKGVGGGEAAAHTFWGFIFDVYKYVSDFVLTCLGLWVFCMIFASRLSHNIFRASHFVICQWSHRKW